MSAPISEATRERLVNVVRDSAPVLSAPARAIVDAIVAALVAEGWRHLPSVMADDEASATGCLCGEPNIPARHCPVHS